MSAKKLFYALCGLLVVIIAAGAYGYYYVSQELYRDTATLSQRLADEQIVDKKLDTLTQLQQQYRQLEPTITKVYDALPVEKQQSRLALQLREIAGVSGMTLDSLTFSPSTVPGPTSQTVKVGDILAVPVTFQLIGTYDQLQRFLQLQENLGRYTNVTSLNISSGTSKSLTFDVTLNAFLKP
ncbi:hypothetical protein EPO04_03840 [Patescibacteria group bacterium]|nr:MAG: hypothetical protein EPO04_03840 [Patescibacteria group bacterium]